MAACIMEAGWGCMLLRRELSGLPPAGRFVSAMCMCSITTLPKPHGHRLLIPAIPALFSHKGPGGNQSTHIDGMGCVRVQSHQHPRCSVCVVPGAECAAGEHDSSARFAWLRFQSGAKGWRVQRYTFPSSCTGLYFQCRASPPRLHTPSLRLERALNRSLLSHCETLYQATNPPLTRPSSGPQRPEWRKARCGPSFTAYFSRRSSWQVRRQLTCEKDVRAHCARARLAGGEAGNSAAMAAQVPAMTHAEMLCPIGISSAQVVPKRPPPRSGIVAKKPPPPKKAQNAGGSAEQPVSIL